MGAYGLSTTERAAVIRAKLKALGISSRDVSVRSDYYSMGSSINITIKSAKVALSLVSLIADEHESVSRCEFSGEILSGGNRYVSVSYSSEALKALAAPYIGKVEAAAAKVTGNYLIPIEGLPGALVGKADNGGLTLWADSYIGNYYNAEALAEKVGVMVLEGAAS